MSWFSRAAEPRERATLLDVTGLTKSFGPLTVLRQVRLQVGPGEIVAAAGGNGAGKSTLIGCIAGVLDADAGDVLFAGQPMPARPVQVRREGIETVWPENGLCDDLDPVASIFLGRPGRWVVSEGALREEAAAVLHRVGARDRAAPGASFVVTLPADPPPGSMAEPTGASWNVVEEPEEQRGG